MNINCFYSNKYFSAVTQLDSSGKHEYYLDSIIKPEWINQVLVSDPNVNIIEPELLAESDLLSAHSREYLDALITGNPKALAESSGLRWVPELYSASLASASAMYSALIDAMTHKVACSLATNFHHATRNHGGGFCVLNGMALSALKGISDLGLKRIAVIDCDYHYGNGTADILKGNPNVDVYDIYAGLHNPSVQVIQAENLHSYHVTNIEQYFSELERLLGTLTLKGYEAILYDSGMDVWENDRLKGIPGMNSAAISKRDTMIFRFAHDMQIPIAFMPGGGYVKYKNADGTALIAEEVAVNRHELALRHANTIKIALVQTVAQQNLSIGD